MCVQLVCKRLGLKFSFCGLTLERLCKLVKLLYWIVEGMGLVQTYCFVVVQFACGVWVNRVRERFVRGGGGGGGRGGREIQTVRHKHRPKKGEHMKRMCVVHSMLCSNSIFEALVSV